MPLEGVQEKIQSVLNPYGGNLMVTPKDVDELIDNTARIIAKGIQKSLFPNLDPSEMH